MLSRDRLGRRGVCRRARLLGRWGLGLAFQGLPGVAGNRVGLGCNGMTTSAWVDVASR